MDINAVKTVGQINTRFEHSQLINNDRQLITYTDMQNNKDDNTQWVTKSETFFVF